MRDGQGVAVRSPGSARTRHGFLDAVPAHPDLDRLNALKKGSEHYQLNGRVFYLHAPEGVGRSRLAAGAKKALGVPMTVRNWNTVCKVLALAAS